DLVIGSGRGGRLGVYENDGKGGFKRWEGAPFEKVLTRDQTGVVGTVGGLVVGVGEGGGGAHLGGGEEGERGECAGPGEQRGAGDGGGRGRPGAAGFVCGRAGEGGAVSGAGRFVDFEERGRAAGSPAAAGGGGFGERGGVERSGRGRAARTDPGVRMGAG